MPFMQPDDDRIKDHGQKKNEREEQNHRLKRMQKQPDDNQQKNEPDDSPCAVITQWSVLIFVLGFVHNVDVGARDSE